jgi:hypothetical protein
MPTLRENYEKYLKMLGEQQGALAVLSEMEERPSIKKFIQQYSDLHDQRGHLATQAVFAEDCAQDLSEKINTARKNNSLAADIEKLILKKNDWMMKHHNLTQQQELITRDLHWIDTFSSPPIDNRSFNELLGAYQKLMSICSRKLDLQAAISKQINSPDTKKKSEAILWAKENVVTLSARLNELADARDKKVNLFEEKLHQSYRAYLMRLENTKNFVSLEKKFNEGKLGIEELLKKVLDKSDKQEEYRSLLPSFVTTILKFQTYYLKDKFPSTFGANTNDRVKEITAYIVKIKSENIDPAIAKDTLDEKFHAVNVHLDRKHIEQIYNGIKKWEQENKNDALELKR